jgi:hypothetical protein
MTSCRLSVVRKPQLRADNRQLTTEDFHEGTGIGKEDLRQVQGHPPSRRSSRDLRELEAQATTRLNSN